MVDPNFSVGVLSSSAALYGFVIAYYVFARLLQEQEHWRLEYEFHGWGLGTEMKLRESVREILRRRIEVTLFLLASTVCSLLALVYTLNAMLGGDSTSLALGMVYLVVQVMIVVFFFATTATLGLFESISAWRHHGPVEAGDGLKPPGNPAKSEESVAVKQDAPSIPER